MRTPTLSFVAVFIALSLALTGCATVPLARVDATRADAVRTPGPRQAQAFAEAVATAARKGEYNPYPKTFARDTAEAIDLLDRTMPAAGPDAATLIAWRAVILRVQGHEEEAVAEMERSFSTSPNELAGEALVTLYGQRADVVSVGRICAPLCMSIDDSNERMRMINVCRDSTNATSAEGETAWMPPELMRWYRSELDRRHEAQVDAQIRQAERDREERIVVRQMEQCTADCKQRALYCQNKCYGRVDCENRCVDINNACVDGCAAEAREKLGE